MENDILTQILQEQLLQKNTEKNLLDMQQGNTRVRKDPNSDIDNAIMQHEKEIFKLKAKKIDPIIEEMKKLNLRRAVTNHLKEKKLSSNQIDLTWKSNRDFAFPKKTNLGPV